MQIALLEANGDGEMCRGHTCPGTVPNRGARRDAAFNLTVSATLTVNGDCHSGETTRSEGRGTGSLPCLNLRMQMAGDGCVRRAALD